MRLSADTLEKRLEKITHKSRIVEHFGHYTIIKKGCLYYLFDNEDLRVVHQYNEAEVKYWNVGYKT